MPHSPTSLFFLGPLFILPPLSLRLLVIFQFHSYILQLVWMSFNYLCMCCHELCNINTIMSSNKFNINVDNRESGQNVYLTRLNNPSNRLKKTLNKIQYNGFFIILTLQIVQILLHISTWLLNFCR